MRSLDEHLSPQELASLPESPQSSAGHDQRLWQHLEQCEECAGLARVHRQLLGLRGPALDLEDAPPPADCPSASAWLEYAGRLHPEQEEEMTAHAAGCPACARELKEAMALIGNDELEASGSAEALAGLASASPQWQRRLAARMVAVGGAAKPGGQRGGRLSEWFRGLRVGPPWMALPAAAVVLVAVIFSGVELWRSQHPSEARLLAEAYNHQRLLPLRIPGGNPVPLATGTRGANTGLTDPSQLLELKLRTQQHLDQTPNSPYWHQVLGEIDLLEQDAAAARSNLEIAQAGDEGLANLRPDLAAAWFELGEKTGAAVDYAQAAELYLAELHNLNDGHPHPAAALLHYNLALCWERQNLNDNALGELREALAAETDATWRKVIQAEIDRLSRHALQPASGNSLAPLERDGYEVAFTNALSTGLPRWPESRAQLAPVAAMGLRHHDRWLADWIAAPHTAVSQQADEHLAAAVRAATGGEAETSLKQAQQALPLYKQAGNIPGRLRAEFAEAYAFQRLGRDGDCVAGAQSVQREPRLAGYALLQAQDMVQQGICMDREGDPSGALRMSSRAAALSSTAAMPQLGLYATGLRASILYENGQAAAALQVAVDTLAACARRNCNSTRLFSILYYMVSEVRDVGLSLTAERIMQNAAAVASGSTDAVTHAYALETLGSVAGLNDNTALSQWAFQEAFRIARTGNQPALGGIYQSEWQTDQAEVLSHERRPQAALQLLQRSAPTMLASNYSPGQTKYYRQASVAQLSLRNYDAALLNAQSAVQVAERALPHIESSAAKARWMRENLPIYAQLVKVYLGRGDGTLALRTWERFRSTAYMPSLAADSPPQLTPLNPAARVLVVARVDDIYVGWLAQPQPMTSLRTVTLGDRAHVQQLATTFYRLCGDRNSRIDDVRTVGAQVYSVLLAPLLGTPAGNVGALWLDLDPSVAMLPIAALPAPGGAWLGESAQIGVLPAWWSLHPAAALQQPAVGRESRMLLVNGFDRSYAGESETNELTALLPHATAIDGPEATTDAVVHHLRLSEVFHFSGHATTDRGALMASEQTLNPDALDGIRLPHLRLAVLAACNTTSADPDQMEELPDLRNALLRAGSQNVVASNWDVDDRSTHSLMLAFYKQLASGLSPMQSLQSAQHAVRSTGGWQHPYFWAAFEDFTN